MLNLTPSVKFGTVVQIVPEPPTTEADRKKLYEFLNKHYGANITGSPNTMQYLGVSPHQYWVFNGSGDHDLDEYKAAPSFDKEVRQSLVDRCTDQVHIDGDKFEIRPKQDS